ncbi:cellulase family glycosylhydrolase [Frigoriglobus tundricola]|uniref:GH5 family retaining endo-beta-1,4-glucanase n=1 Tax=Frigoriglobus tundricola TaxID=2774151 RepID=A0A6M5Z4D6_9BACT|nr:cellulase family glycosylhydrolase [Frigoriglobus tundricola]QJX00361.1 GH5 family retaining endo-beta-1,4-glucanase [Frigoriglobus tundricola]
MPVCPICCATALGPVALGGRSARCPKCRGAEAPGRSRRTGRFRPSLEELEQVLVPSVALHVVGTQLETPSGQVVQLRGVNVDGQEGWSNPAGGLVYNSDVKDSVESAFTAALDVWHANLIRLPINQDFWQGLDPGVNATTYISDIDHLVQQAASAGAYVMLDVQVSDGGTGDPLLESGDYSLPDNNTAAFWTSAARHYAANPAAFFDLFNEPGHFIANYTQYKSGAAQFNDTVDGRSVSYASPGMQGLINDIRGAGSNNIIAAEGMGYADDFSAIAAAITGGNGLADSARELMYSVHIYPNSVPDSSDVSLLNGLLPAAVAARYPVYVGEWGADVDPGAEGAPATSAAVWNQDLLTWLATQPYSWTAWAMNAEPWLTVQGTTTPTTYFGQLVLNDLTTPSEPAVSTAEVRFTNTDDRGTSTSTSGNPVTYTVQVSGGVGIPTGTVNFYNATTGAFLGVANLDGNGFAQLTTSVVSVGTSVIQVVYSGDGNYRAASATVKQVITDVPLYAAGSATGGPGIVTAFSPMTGSALIQFAPFGAYAGGVKVAVGDVTGDGYDDLIVMAGPGALNGLVEIYSGKDFSLVSEYFAFPGYPGEFNIAVGGLTGTGVADVIFSTATGGDFVFAYAGASTQMITLFSAFGGFTGGVTIAAGDVLRRGYDQIIVGTASRLGAAGVFNTAGQLLQPYDFAPIPMNGVNVAAGDLNNSGHDDIIFGARTGSTLVLEYDGESQDLMGWFFAYPGQSFGVTVATVDPTGDGYADIVTGFTGNVSAIALYSGLSFQLMTVDGQPSGAGGVNVAGSGDRE